MCWPGGSPARRPATWRVYGAAGRRRRERPHDDCQSDQPPLAVDASWASRRVAAMPQLFDSFNLVTVRLVRPRPAGRDRRPHRRGRSRIGPERDRHSFPRSRAMVHLLRRGGGWGCNAMHPPRACARGPPSVTSGCQLTGRRCNALLRDLGLGFPKFGRCSPGPLAPVACDRWRQITSEHDSGILSLV